MRQEREVVARGEAGVHEAEREEIVRLHHGVRERVARDDEHGPERRQIRRRQAAVEGIEQHADAEQVQHAEPDDDVAVCEAREIHPPGHERDGHAAAEDNRAALHAVRAERHADARDQHEDRAAVLLDIDAQRGEVGLEAHEIAEIEEQVDDDHAEDAEPAQRVELPDPSFLQLRHTASFGVKRPAWTAFLPLPPRARGRRPCRPASWAARGGTRCRRASRTWRSDRCSIRGSRVLSAPRARSRGAGRRMP